MYVWVEVGKRSEVYIGLGGNGRVLGYGVRIGLGYVRVWIAL